MTDHYLLHLEQKNRQLHAVNDHLRATLARVEALRDKWERAPAIQMTDGGPSGLWLSAGAASRALTRALSWEGDQ